MAALIDTNVLLYGVDFGGAGKQQVAQGLLDEGAASGALKLAHQVLVEYVAAEFQLPWYDAHLWAYAEHYGLDTLYSEDFQHDRRYGGVRVVHPCV